MGKRKMDLTHLSEEECSCIVGVIQKDFEVRAKERERLRLLQHRLSEEDRRVALLADKDFNDQFCILCFGKFMLLFNPKRLCSACRRNVCKGCSDFVFQFRNYICKLCQKDTGLVAMNCRWFYETLSRRFKDYGSVAVAKSICRSQKRVSESGNVHPRSRSAIPAASPAPSSRLDDNLLTPVLLEKVRAAQITKFRQKVEDATSRMRTQLRAICHDASYSEFEKNEQYEKTAAIHKNELKGILQNLSQVLYITLEKYNVAVDEPTADIDSAVLQIVQDEVENQIGYHVSLDEDDAANSLISDQESLAGVEKGQAESRLAQCIVDKLMNDHQRYLDDLSTKDATRLTEMALKDLEISSEHAHLVMSTPTALPSDLDADLPDGSPRREVDPDVLSLSGVSAVSSSTSCNGRLKGHRSTGFETRTKIDHPAPHHPHGRDKRSDSLTQKSAVTLRSFLSPNATPRVGSREVSDLSGSDIDDNEDRHDATLKRTSADGDVVAVPKFAQQLFLSDKAGQDREGEKKWSDSLSADEEGSLSEGDNEDGFDFEGIYKANLRYEQQHNPGGHRPSLTDSEEASRILMGESRGGRVGAQEQRNRLKLHLDVQSPEDSGVHFQPERTYNSSSSGSSDGRGSLRSFRANGDGAAIDRWSREHPTVTDPYILVRPDTFAVLEGESLDVRLEVDGTLPINLFWFKGSGEDLAPIEPSDKIDIVCQDTSSPSQHSLLLWDARPSDAGRYLVIATNKRGSDQHEFTIQVNENRSEFKRPEFVIPFQDLEVAPGRTARFTCKVVGYPPPKITFLKNGEKIEIEDSKKYNLMRITPRQFSLSIYKVSEEDEGIYSCRLVNRAGTDQSDAPLICTPPPLPEPFAQAPYTAVRTGGGAGPAVGGQFGSSRLPVAIKPTSSSVTSDLQRLEHRLDQSTEDIATAIEDIDSTAEQYGSAYGPRPQPPVAETRTANRGGPAPQQLTASLSSLDRIEKSLVNESKLSSLLGGVPSSQGKLLQASVESVFQQQHLTGIESHIRQAQNALEQTNQVVSRLEKQVAKSTQDVSRNTDEVRKMEQHVTVIAPADVSLKSGVETDSVPFATLVHKFDAAQANDSDSSYFKRESSITMRHLPASVQARYRDIRQNNPLGSTSQEVRLTQQQQNQQSVNKADTGTSKPTLAAKAKSATLPHTPRASEDQATKFVRTPSDTPSGRGQKSASLPRNQIQQPWLDQHRLDSCGVSGGTSTETLHDDDDQPDFLKVQLKPTGRKLLDE